MAQRAGKIPANLSVPDGDSVIVSGTNWTHFTPVLSQSNQQITAYAVSNTTQSTSGTFNASNLSFAGAGNVSVGISNGSVMISATGGGVGGAGTNTFGMSDLGNSAGTTGGVTGTGIGFYFAGGNNVTLSQSLNGSTGTITVSGAAFRSHSFGVSDVGNTSGDTGRIQSANMAVLLAGSNNITLEVSKNVGSDAQTIYIKGQTNALTSQSNQALSAANGSFTFHTATFANSNGVSFSTGTQGLYASHNGLTAQSVQTQNMVSVLGSTGNVSFANSNGITFGGNNSTITASHNGITSQSNQALSGANGSFAFQTATFADSNGVSFSTGTQGMFATVRTNYAASDHSHGNPTLALTNLSGSTASGSAGLTLSLSANVGGGGLTNVNLSAGTTSQNLSAFVFSNANNVSFGLNGSTVTASASGGGGGGYSLYDYQNIDRISLNNITNMTATGVTQRPLFVPFELGGSLTQNAMHVQVSRAASGSNAFTLQAALYTFVNSTSLARLASLQNVFSNSDTASVSGVRLIRLTGWENAGTALTPGQYVMMLYASATATKSMNYSWMGGATVNPPVGMIGGGTNAVSTATTALSNIGWRGFQGRYTTTTASPPAGVAFNAVQQWTSGNVIYFHMGRT